MIINLKTRNVTQSTVAPSISLNGLILTVGDVDIDLSLIPDGGQAIPDDASPLTGVCTRDYVEVKYPYSNDIYELNQPSDPSVYEIKLFCGETLPCPLIKRNPENV